MGRIEYSMYQEIINEMWEAGIPSARLQYYGEPLLHHLLPVMIQYATSKDICVDFDTNGYLLSPEISKKLINSGLDELVISIHGMTPEEYITVHNIDAFDKVINNVKTLIRLRDAHNSDMKIIIQSARMDTNIQNFDKIKELIGEGVTYSLVNCGYNPSIHKEDRRVNKGQYTRSLPCTSLYQMLAISWDGDITVCCADPNFNLKVGRFEDGIINTWNGRRLRELRENHKRGVFPAICQHCPDPTQAR